MNIILTTELYLPGTNGMITAVRGIAETLTALGHTVTLIAPESWHAAAWAAKHNVVLMPMYAITASARIGQRLAIWPPPRKATKAALHQADIIHLHSPFLTGLRLGRMARDRDLPVVVTNHALPENLISAIRLPLPSDHSVSASAIWTWIGKGQRLANLATSPSLHGAQLIKRKFGQVPIRVMSNGIKQKDLAVPANINDSGPFKALYVGRLQREKRVDELIGAVRACAHAGVVIHLTIVGDGPDRRRLERLSAELGVARQVTFAGLVSDDERDWHYEACHCFWMASRSELQCCAALEAMASARPVIASRAGALPETVPDGVAGLLYTPGEEQSIVEIMTRLAKDRELYRRLSIGALDSARKHSLSRVAGLWVDLYRAVIANSNGTDRLLKWREAHV